MQTPSNQLATASNAAMSHIALPHPHAPWAYREALPVLYWVTFIIICFLHPLQKAFLVFGTFTCTPKK
jgi:hypothetical protein